MTEEPKWGVPDVLQAVFTLMSTKNITADTPTIHNALHNLQAMEEFHDLFAEMDFRDEGRFFFCEDMETYFVAWQMSGMMSCLAPWYEEYIFLPKMQTHFDHYRRKLFTEKELRKISKASEYLEICLAKVKSVV